MLWKLRDVMAILDNHYKLEKVNGGTAVHFYYSCSYILLVDLDMSLSLAVPGTGRVVELRVVRLKSFC